MVQKTVAARRSTDAEISKKVSPEVVRQKRTLWQKVLRWWKRTWPILYVAWLYVSWKLRKWLQRPDFVFAVYGNDRQQAKFFPKWARTRMRGAFPITRIKFRGKRGFICATPRSESEINNNPTLAVGYSQNIRREFPRMKGNFALAGRIPSWVMKAQGKGVETPFRDGVLGTRYVMLATAEALAQRKGRSATELTIAVAGGAGHVGSLVVSDLAKRFHQVVALDPRYTETKPAGNVVYTANPSVLKLAQLLIVLTGKGEDVRSFSREIPAGMFIADDTHPPIPEDLLREVQEQGATVLKTVAEAENGVVAWPNLPGFLDTSVPGCLLQCIVEMCEERAFSEQEFDEFSVAAQKLGFYARLLPHPND